MKIGIYEIGPGQRPFIISELSGNHNQSLERALKLVELSAAAGAHAVKLQTYTADSITIDCDLPDFVIHDKKSLWVGKNLYALYQQASTPYDWHESIFKRCRELGIICFSTPFDETAVDFLEQFSPPCYKIASFENNHYPLISKVLRTGKPLIISLGLSTLQDIDDLNEFLVREGAKDVLFLKCTSAYPARPEDANIQTIPFLAQRYGRPVGISDHTLGNAVSVASVALGGCVIEKHFTDSRSAGGVDAAFSIEPLELKQLVQDTELTWKSIGKPTFDLSDDEKRSLCFKRSIYVVRDIESGEMLTSENIRIIRPGMGLAPKYYDKVLGMRARTRLVRGTALVWDKIGI